MKNENASVEQVNYTIPQIEINDALAFMTGCRVLLNVLIRSGEGLKKYRILRTSNGKYVMQI